MAQVGLKGRWGRWLAGASLLMLLSSSAWAQEGGGEEGVIYKKKTVVSFGDDTIDGDLTKPDGDYVESRKRVRHSNLIKIREDFREKILNSISTL